MRLYVVLFSSLLLFSACLSSRTSYQLDAKIFSRHVLIKATDSNGQKTAHALIHVKNSKGERVLFGNADENGLFLFAPPRIEDLRIIIVLDGKSVAEHLVTKGELEARFPKPPRYSIPQP